MATSNTQVKKAIAQNVKDALRKAEINPTTKAGNRELSKLIHMLMEEDELPSDLAAASEQLSKHVVATLQERNKKNIDGAAIRTLIAQRRSLFGDATEAAVPESTKPAAAIESDPPTSEAADAPAKPDDAPAASADAEAGTKSKTKSKAKSKTAENKTAEE
ncbi:hypothetical protein KR51_00007700 [Rubidibacter lacunae KORDI 51-2]|uniref:Uncharacterized protein n=1 Tax=Rubidibacter lacunae KORDI 51-2 TaxID=582515 RepID=U5DLA2_9CHRO|nr:hypothetical protein [Rubidibacter lacunae]ERN42461.1 hypothetical protein KR51_00007700 [Rubidibacter lacunae KORDI 51-2]